MKVALLVILSLSALAYAGPAFNKNNQIDTTKQQQQQYMTTGFTDVKQSSQAVEILKQWCFSSQMSQPELTSSFKKLVSVIKSSPTEQSTESAVMGERICQGANVQKSQQSGDISTQTGVDAQAHELIKDVYMDALISCKSRDCTEQLLKIIKSNQIDSIRASYYMTRLAVTEKDSIKDESEIKQLAESFVSSPNEQSEAVERQKLFAVTSLIGKLLKSKPQQANGELKQTVEQVVKTIVERYIKPVNTQDVQQYQSEQTLSSPQVANKIAKRSAALKALANIPGWMLKECVDVEQVLVQLSQNKQELTTVRQSAIECLEQNEQVADLLKQITFDQQEPIEVRIAAYRALMTVGYVTDASNSSKQTSVISNIIDQVVKHCEQERNQQNDDQFVLYAISHLDNMRSSQQPEHAVVKECISKNKQHYMQIQVLCKKYKQQLDDVRKSSRNYKLEQEFNQIESGLIIEGDIVYESKHKQQQQYNVLPKLVRVNMSMPVMGETVNVIELTVRQNQMDDEILSALKLVDSVKLGSSGMSKIVDSFKNVASKQQEKNAEADLTIKIDGCTVLYLCADDFKSSSASSSYSHHQRQTRSTYSIVDEIIEHLKRKPISFNRGFNFNIDERLAKLVDLDANIIAGLRFESRANGQSSQDFEIVAQAEPRFSFEAIVGPAKVSSKKLLQRVSSKSALGLRLRFKKNQLVDVQVDLPMNTMELFTFETQLVEKSTTTRSSSSSSYDNDDYTSYNYLPTSIYGQEDIYSRVYNNNDDLESMYYNSNRLMKRSLFEKKTSAVKQIGKWISGKSTSFVHTFETPEKVARATGLRAKLAVAVGSPKDMSVVIKCLLQKYEPSMQGYRVQVQKSPSSSGKQYIVTVSTPGSRLDRTMQVRVSSQMNSQRSIVKADVKLGEKMDASVVYELVHDGRQYVAKCEIVSRNGQWRHLAEAGLVRGSQSASGRVASTYKPYVNIESSSLKRPLQLQGVVSYADSPKSVISYELKCPTSGDYVQGKIIADARQTKYSSSSSSSLRKRSMFGGMRSMQSPLELLVQKDLTLTSELVAQIGEHAVKMHQMIDWDATKTQVQADFTATHKHKYSRSSANFDKESQLVANMKLSPSQQVLTVGRKCVQEPRKDFRVQVVSQLVSARSHQMLAEVRYNGRRQSNAVVSYKHKIDCDAIAYNKLDAGITVELLDTESQFDEKMSGRVRAAFERKMKTVQAQLSSRTKTAKIELEYASLGEHQLQVYVKSERFQHKCEMRANKRFFVIESRTDKHGQLLAKILFQYGKQGQDECKLIVDLPTKRTTVALDVELASGKRSSFAVQTPRYASKGEFSFESVSRSFASSFGAPNKASSLLSSIIPTFVANKNYRIKSDLKDMLNKEAYWMDSAINYADDSTNSYFRLDSPIYRSELEYEPREQRTKLGMFARSKRSVNSFDSIYSTKDSIIEQAYDLINSQSNNNNNNKINMGNKLWMLRSVLSSPSLKEKARRALFEYADRRQAHKHSLNWEPAKQRFDFDLVHKPNSEYEPMSWQPMRMSGELNTNWSRPSRLSLSSDLMDFDLDGQLYNSNNYDDIDAYAKLSALSRHRRSPFKKHDSEYRYNKESGHKASMKHVDAEDRRHSWQMEADKDPKKWAKMSYDSDKHGKFDYEHKWRKHMNKNKRASNDDDITFDSTDDLIDVSDFDTSSNVDYSDRYYKNKITFNAEAPHNKWSHRSTFDWTEPIKMSSMRQRRSIDDLAIVASDAKRNNRYSAIDYLKRVNARLNSQTRLGNNQFGGLYKVDFDYKPQQSAARLNVNMPEDMLHASSIEFKPSERLYKLQSKLYNIRSNEPTYDLYASTKPIVTGLATDEQEPVFVHDEHPMLERPITNSLVANIFKQPLKLDYSDKYGRVASFDYDQSPMLTSDSSKLYGGLRQKRAAVYYKDDSNDFEHSSSYDFYPETSFGSLKPSYKRVPGDVAFKTSTKYGPIVVRADTNDKGVQVDIVSPLMSGKLSGEMHRGSGVQLIKVDLDNKQQRVQLEKIVRNIPVVRDCKLAKDIARKIDSSRFEHSSEILVSIVDAVLKIKSRTLANERPVLVIEGELNKQQGKVYAKINGERVNGQLVADLINKSANLVVDVDDKRTFEHVTRLARTSDKFYTIESVTSHKSKPVFKLNGKISAMVLEEPAHLFTSSKRRSSTNDSRAYLSFFQATIYEPNEIHVTGQYDCLDKRARIVFKNVDENKLQETSIKFDDQTGLLHVDARLTSPRGQIYVSKANINLPSLVNTDECYYQSCQSEIFYSDKTGNWNTKFVPNDYVQFDTPLLKRTLNLAY